MKPIYIIDTNVLLDDPQVIYSFPNVELVIPQGVLAELDKLKTMRTDGRLRFHGREISRILFQLAQENVLTEGVDLKNGARLRVGSFESDRPLPDSLKTKNTDDQILALAYQLSEQNSEREVVLITSDLNMLLRAQALGLQIKHFEEVYSPGFFRTVWNQLRIKSRSLVWFIPLIVAVIMVVFFTRNENTSSISPELLKTLSPQQLQYFKYEEILKDSPQDTEALAWLGDYFGNQRNYGRAIDYYSRLLTIQPDDLIYRTRRGVSYFYTKDYNKAASDLKAVTTAEATFAEAHFWLGMVYVYGFSDPNGALAEFNIYLQLEPSGQHSGDAQQQIQIIQAQLNQIEKQNTGQ